MASAQMQVTFETVCSTFDEIFKYEGSTVPEGYYNANLGTSLKFAPVPGIDSMVKNGITQQVFVKHQCITVMRHYASKSFEELRFEDFLAGWKTSTDGPPLSFFGAVADTPVAVPTGTGSIFPVATTEGSGLSLGSALTTTNLIGTGSTAAASPGASGFSNFGATMTSTHFGTGPTAAAAPEVSGIEFGATLTSTHSERSDDEKALHSFSQLKGTFPESLIVHHCDYRRNPFTVIEKPKPVDNTNIMREQQPFSGPPLKKRRHPHGFGKLTTLTGQFIYEGEWREGKRHGKGEAVIVSCESKSLDDTCGYYKGDWKDNMRHGHGTMWFPSGAKYVGKWHHDKLSGCGIMSYRDGSTIEGNWHEGVVDGCCLFTWPHGATEYRQYEGEKVLHSSPVERDAAKEISNRNEQSAQILRLSGNLRELKLEQATVTEAMENLRSTLRTELKVLEEYAKTKEKESSDMANAYREQIEEYKKKLGEVESENRQLEMKVEQAMKVSSLCQICFDRKRDCIIMPCTHLLYCRQCLAEHKRKGKNDCPACRGPISGELNCNLEQ